MSALHRVCVLAGLALMATSLQAQSPTGRAATYACMAGQTCADTGDCQAIPYALFVIETFIGGTEVGPTYFAGPQPDGARAAIFVEQPIQLLHGAQTPEEWFTRLPVIFGPQLFARVPDPDANRYIVIRPSDQVSGLAGDRVVTEFLCTQELFP